MLLSACDPEQMGMQAPSASTLSAPERPGFGAGPQAPVPDIASGPRDPAFVGPAAADSAAALRDAPNTSGQIFDGPGFKTAAYQPPIQIEAPRADLPAPPRTGGAKRLERPFSVSGRSTVYYPTAARSKKQRAIEGPNNDRLGRALCTAEGFARGSCDSITVAIDQRLHARYGTKVESPELEAAFMEHCRARGFSSCRRPVFAIRDTGACWAFKGLGHIDVATESNENSGFGKALNLSRTTLEFPDGLPRDMRLRNTCRN